MTTTPVRPEYEALARDLERLAAYFDVTFDEPLRRNLVQLSRTFETIDRHVDDTAEPAERSALCATILRAFDDDSAVVPAEVAERITWVRTVLDPRGTTGAFAGSLRRFFAVSETLRTTRRASVYVACVLGEARRAAEMTLLVGRELDVPRFARFFRVLSEVANLVDKLHDIGGDRRRGEIALDASPWVYVRLLTAFVARGPVLLWLCPRPLRLITWGVTYLLPVESAYGARTSSREPP